MKVAITGSSGLIGTALRDELAAAGHEVIRIVRRSSPSAGDISWDPVAGKLDRAAMEGIDAVVNLAGEGIGNKRWSDQQKQKLVDSRVKGTTLLAETLAGMDRPPAVLLSGSAIGFYGDRGDQVLTERSDAGHSFLGELCVKWEGATAAASQAGIRVAHLRTGVVLSKQGGALAKMLPLFKFGLGGKMGSGRAYWSWISLADEVGAIAFLLEHPVSGPVNLTAPAPVTNAEFTKALGQVLHRPTLLPVPAFGPKLLLGAELADALLFSSARVLPQALNDAGYSFHHPDVTSGLESALSDGSLVSSA